MRQFQAFNPNSTFRDAITPEALARYREHLLSSRQGVYTVWHKLRKVKALVAWAYEMELIETLPRALNRFAKIGLPAPHPQFYTVAEVQALFQRARRDMKLWVLLGLNCGYTQNDIATLTPAMLKNGILARDRQKTGVESEHRLWPCTAGMLAAQAKKGPLLLTTTGGLPLVHGHLRKDGTPSRTDMISHNFVALKVKVGTALSFKHFRKTAAEAIAQQNQDKPWLVELFLAHADPRMRKHYTRQHYDELHKATDRLCGHFGLEAATGN